MVVGLFLCHCHAKELGSTTFLVSNGVDETVYSDEGLEHPCTSLVCGDGQECVLDDSGMAECACIKKCIPSSNDIPLCSTRNETFSSECSFLRERCLCVQGSSECEDKAHVSAHMDYYGKCQELPECEEAELEEFPIRMREWLYLVMEELDEREDLSEGAHRMLEEAKGQTSRRWVLPVIWKFCELDQTGDRFMNTDELRPITAPLKPVEHCTATFLENCDVDNNGRIDIVEWGSCLQLEDDEIEDRCDDLRN